jgi:hypothetical protein
VKDGASDKTNERSNAEVDVEGLGGMVSYLGINAIERARLALTSNFASNFTGSKQADST